MPSALLSRAARANYWHVHFATHVTVRKRFYITSTPHPTPLKISPSRALAVTASMHTVYPRSEVFSRSSRYSEAQPDQAEAKQRTATPIYVKCWYCTCNRSSWLQGGSFPVSCCVHFLTFGFLYTSQSTFSFFISAICRPNRPFFKTTTKRKGKRSHLVHFGYCHYVIKYLTRDMINYHCLRVFRSRVRRIGKHSPGFSVFRTIVRGCSNAELCPVPIQSTVGAIFFFLCVCELLLFCGCARTVFY